MGAWRGVRTIWRDLTERSLAPWPERFQRRSHAAAGAEGVQGAHVGTNDGAEAACLREAIASLPPRYRRILLLHAIDDLSLAELGERLSMSRRRVERRLARAIALLSEYEMRLERRRSRALRVR